MPHSYLLATLGPQVPAWRGIATVVWKGGKYGAMNPYPRPASYKISQNPKGWDHDACWYPEKAAIGMQMPPAWRCILPSTCPAPWTMSAAMVGRGWTT